jgi:general secretion pathway protein D
MNAHYRLKPFIALCLAGLLTAGCASNQAYKRGTRAEIARDYETAMEEYRVALADDPGNIEYRLKYEQTRFAAAYERFQRGRRALDAGDVTTARAEFARALEIDPTHDFARRELADIDKVIAARAQKQPEPLLNVEELQQSLRTSPNLGSRMRTTLTEPITLNMTTESRAIYENLAAAAGLSVMFDSAFRSQRTTVNITTPVNIFEALDIVSMQTRNFWQPVNETTFIVAEDNPTKRRDLEEMMFKIVYVSNTTTPQDLTQIVNVIRTSLGLRQIFQYEGVNAIVIRDTPDRIALAEHLIRALDKAKAEVVVEATVIEVDRNQLRDLGIIPPGETVFGFTPPGGNADSNEISLRGLDAVNSGDFSVTVPDSVARFLATNATAKLLQNPKIRTTEGATASLRVGSEVPVPTTTFTNTTIGQGANTSYTMSQVGVQMDIVARVLLNREISLNVTVTVRALAGERNVGNLLIPVFSNRVVAQTIKLAEGETNILGGIISDTEATSVTGIPGLKDIPFLKYIFGQEHKTRDQAEVLIMLTPHIIRMPDITAADLTGVFVGTELNPRLRPNYNEGLAPAPAGTTPPAGGTPPAGPANSPPGPAGPGAALTPGPVTAPALNTSPAPPPPTVPVSTVLPPGAPTTAVVSFSPTPMMLAAQGQTPINLAINGPDIAGTEITVSFDPAAFSIREIREAGFLSRDGQMVALVQNIDNQRGVARITLERSPGAQPVSGSGNLLALVLQPGAQKGPSTLRITEFA